MVSRALRPLCIAVVLALAAGLLPLLLGASAQAAPAAGAAPGAVDRPVARVFDRLAGFRLDRSRAVTVVPRAYRAFRLDAAKARAALTPARATSAPLRVVVPTPTGASQVFSVVEDSVMAPALAARHPEIRTYAGRGVTDPTRTIRLDLTPLGFHASVRGPSGARSWYVDPAYRGRGVTEHLSYFGTAVPRSAEAFVERDLADTADILSTAPGTDLAARAGELVKRRTFRLALVTDPSYAAEFGTANVLAAKNTLINRVNQVYNDDLAITFQLIEQTPALNLDTLVKATGVNGPCGNSGCYDPADIDPETGGCTGALLTRTEFVLGQIVGADSFDIGHIGLGINGGGIAGLGVVGGASKASGCTGLPDPKGDFYAVDYVAHEIGHQMGGNHTFDGTQVNCSLTNRNGGTSVEPGSGSSVMAYAGICGQDNLQPHSDPYFSQRSIDEITAVVTADPSTVDEVQTVTFRGFDAPTDSVTLGFEGRTATITNDSTYNALQLQLKMNTLTGRVPTLGGYDGDLTPNDGGFQLSFDNPGVGSGEDLPRLQVLSTTGTMSAFIGVQQQGGPGGNQGNVVQTTTNHAPTVVAPADKTIPAQTPFTLTGSGSDLDVGTTLTYLWEQNDVGSEAQGTALVSNTKTAGPLFRVFGRYADVSREESLQSPSPDQNLADGNPSRTFPDLAQVVSGNTNAKTGACPEAPADTAVAVPVPVVECFSEFLPTADYGNPLLGSELNFRLTARDGFPTGGGASFDDVTLTVDTAAGPFLATSRATAGTPAEAGAMETVTWDVAGTAAATLAPMVKISLSTDGGVTFPLVLAASTPNDGTQAVGLPSVSTTRARIKIEAVGNYFFDVTDADFAIEGGLTVTDAPDGAVAYSDVLTGVTATATSTSVDGDQLTATVSGVPGLVATRTAASADGVRPGTATFAVTGPVTASLGVATASLEVREPGTGGGVAVQSIPVTVTAEDATVAYTGDTSVAGPDDTASVVLRSTVTDAVDASRGVVTNATVRFVDRADGATLCTAPVTGGPLAGTAQCTAELPTSASGSTYDVGTVVGGRYARDAAADDVEVTATRGSAGAPPQTRITGGLPQHGFVVAARPEVRYASSAPGSTFTCAIDSRLLDCDAAGVVLSGLKPGMHTFRVAARDSSGTADVTPASRRFTVPQSARVLTRATKGWSGGKTAGAYRGFALTTRARNARLTYQVRGATRLAIVAGTAPGNGRVKVFVGNRLLTTLVLTDDAPRSQVLFVLKGFTSPVSGTVRLVSVDRRPVRIEGLGVLTR
ncbi:M12 family metallo-peptidase [Nocardioides sp.]|uniref:M12 family metallo-peptidase n=1 Tax=Nocardioides sp. TaxID=35761 RepID=UPI00286C2008|nr:M12 family metallo-peptidase [Nocardioides sp.]